MTHTKTLCFSPWCWPGSIQAGCYSDAGPGSCWVQECGWVLWVVRFPCQDAIIRAYHMQKSWTKAWKWSGVVGIFEILNADQDDCDVAAWELEWHLARPTGADEVVFIISLTVRVRYIHMLALGQRKSQYEVAMQCNTRGYPLQNDVVFISQARVHWLPFTCNVTSKQC